MKPFWRKEPLSPEETALVDALFKAHAKSALRGNMSSMAVQIAWQGSGDYGKAIAAGLMTLGLKHAPVETIWKLLAAADSRAFARDLLLKKKKVPGWGNAFVKGGPDPLWGSFMDQLMENFTPMSLRIREVTHELHEAGKKIYPNPGCYTAATALILKLPAALSPYLFLAARLDAWSSLMTEHA